MENNHLSGQQRIKENQNEMFMSLLIQFFRGLSLVIEKRTMKSCEVPKKRTLKTSFYALLFHQATDIYCTFLNQLPID